MPEQYMNTAEVRRTFENLRGRSHAVNAALALCDEVDRLKAENAKLQKALEAYATPRDGDHPLSGWTARKALGH